MVASFTVGQVWGLQGLKSRARRFAIVGSGVGSVCGNAQVSGFMIVGSGIRGGRFFSGQWIMVVGRLAILSIEAIAF
jgi:hypothetical protein